ncbi:MAG TPA: discoidin domain-containing protein [Polyangiaceae bacterium]|nr:discoidin domain-containing protein [Polyangiaceae bacterium]
MASRWQALAWLLPGAGKAGANVPALSPRCSTLVGRAQLANLLAERTFRPTDALPFPGADAVACELAREAIYWALLALRELAQPDTRVAAEASSPASDPSTLEALWSETERELLDRAAGGSAQAEQVRADLLSKSFADFAELSPERQTAIAERLHAFAERLIEPLAHPQRAQERVWATRFSLLVAAAAVLIALLFVGKSLKDEHDMTLDLAPSASWKASSQIQDCSCKSPEQSCSECPNFFFHTLEENQPWIIFDLHRVQSLSAVVVENRPDCCSERAVPLVVQVSKDQKHWKTVATRKGAFTTWRADFSTEQARWVKLYVAKRDYLHLAGVHLLP